MLCRQNGRGSLEDGQRVFLLRLESGRAAFDVAKDAQRPFSVAVGDRVVVATGTEFSVEKVNREIPFDGLRWFFDHAETVSDANLERVRALEEAVTP